MDEAVRLSAPVRGVEPPPGVLIASIHTLLSSD